MKRLLLILLCLGSFAVQAAERALIVGVVPQQAAVTLAAAWLPLLNQLSAKSGLKLQFATAPDIPAFEQRAAAGEYDFAYMNPLHFVSFSRNPGYKALARENSSLQGILVVAANSPIQDINELQGKALAFPAPAAFAATVLPQAELRQRKISFSSRYVGSHDSVYLAVIEGLVPAGGGITRTLNNLPAEQRARLRILWQTASYTPHPLVYHSRVAPAERNKLLQALLALGKDDAGRQLLKAAGFGPFVAARDSDWDDIRQLSRDQNTKP